MMREFVGIILGILIADDILELFGKNGDKNNENIT